ncbi:hypothetical protein SMC26_18875 [Actinomadura fulvescens]|uniref:Uncharacterized protein n=1 Tax=Actinomadura fulvescens TaxID=46160 RepID=A0ABN3QGL1_9ACTN
MDELKNIIFTSTANKLRIVLRDALNNQIDIVENEEVCLVYDRQLTLSEGLTWGDMIAWWRVRGKFPKRWERTLVPPVGRADWQAGEPGWRGLPG